MLPAETNVYEQAAFLKKRKNRPYPKYTVKVGSFWDIASIMEAMCMLLRQFPIRPSFLSFLGMVRYRWDMRRIGGEVW